MKYLLAHDIGTSGNKASLFTVYGEMVGSVTESYGTDYRDGGIAEQNPEDWWRAVCDSTRKLLIGVDPADIIALSFSAQMQCCLVVDKAGKPLRPAIIWADSRAQKQADELTNALGADEGYKLLGHRISPSYSIEKLMWIRDNEPVIYEQTYKMLQVKDYIIMKMTGKFVTDYSDASGTNALDLAALDWSDKVLSIARIDRDKLPELHASTDCIGKLTEEAASALGLTTITSVITGGGDGPCSAVGAGCIKPGQMYLTYGTSSWIGGTTDTKFVDEEQVLFCFAHVIPGKFMPCGTMQSAGSSYAYGRSIFCLPEQVKATEEGVDSWDLINKLVSNSPVGAKGLIFLPYLTGERSPRWNPDAAGSFQGIRMYHERGDYMRAILEGVAMNLELILKSYRKYMDIDDMILTGGGAKGDIVARILSDVLQVSLVRPDHVEEATSIAAAVIAGVGCGVYEDFTAVDKYLKFDAPIEPNKSVIEVYNDAKEQFETYYQALKDLY